MTSQVPDLPIGGNLFPANATSSPYRVLARKYRPSNFGDLIGQEPMVRTLSNAFALGRIHQAYILTGVRGVGKTTTARILARAFNYQIPGQSAHPSVDMMELGVHCQAIIESRHVDVIEMDAASHTGIDDVREIIENARYLPVMAATKVFIIDEVHMLSKQAFNGLLKTLEEPPAHVKFLFATTEIDKVPVTVRSRCQRFDLRRIEIDVMIAHLTGICAIEQVVVHEEALAMIARASEGSVRDALSILDQAIAHGAGPDGITAETLRAMLGLADRTRIIDLFEATMRGDIVSALAALKEQNNNGADPAQILTELAEFVHFVTRLKLVPDAGRDASMTQSEYERGMGIARQLSLPVLTRAWQLLTKGITETRESARSMASADMVLVRLCYAADLPTPDEALRKLASMPVADTAALPRPAGGGGGARLAVSAPVPRQTSMPEPALQNSPYLARFEDVVALAAGNRDIQLKTALERDVRLLRFQEGTIEFALVPGASPQIAQTLMRRLQEWTRQRWMVVVSASGGAPSLKEQADSRDSERRSGIEANPLVRSALEHFPGARIIDVRRTDDADPAPTSALEILDNPAANEDVGYADTLYSDDDL